MRRIVAEPQGLSTVDRSELFAGIRSLHIRHSRSISGTAAARAARRRLAILRM